LLARYRRCHPNVSDDIVGTQCFAYIELLASLSTSDIVDLVSTRTRILEATATLLASSPDADVSTRAICDAAGVGAPALYRQFGDKDGLLRAVIDHAFGEYLASKRALVPSEDPAADLKAGWDSHLAFALANPTIYRLMHSTGVTAPSEAVEESFVLLREVLDRCATAGRLRMSTATAAQLVMAATIGMALSLITRPDQYPDRTVADRLRDAVMDSVLTDVAASKKQRPSRSSNRSGGTQASATASALSAQLTRDPSPAMTGGETALLHEWLHRLADGPAGRTVEDPARSTTG
jgi:AcrR family transcriptional regulator